MPIHSSLRALLAVSLALPGLAQEPDRSAKLSGFGTLEDKDEAARAGFDSHLTKPVDPATLGPMIARIPPPVSEGLPDGPCTRVR